MYHKDRAKVVKKNEIRKQINQKVYFLSKFFASSLSSPHRLSPHSPITLSPQTYLLSPCRMVHAL